MRAIVPLIVVVAAIVLGFWFVGSGDAPGGAVSSSDRGLTPAVAGDEDADLVAPSEEDAGSTRPARAAPESGGDASAAPAQGGAPATFTGRVVDALDRPIEGASIQLRTARSALHTTRTLATRTSDEDGAFRITTDTEGGMDLVVLAHSYAPKKVQVFALPGEEQALGGLPLDMGVVLAGQVVDEGGRPVADAEILRPPESGPSNFVIRGRPDAGELLTVTDDEGRFEIGNQGVGEWELKVRHERHPIASIAGHTDRPGDHRLDLLVTLEDGLEIRGLVRGVPGDERELLEVRAQTDTGVGQTSWVGDLGAAPSEPVETRTAEIQDDGTFVVQGLRAGSYRVNARLGGGTFFDTRARSATALADAGDRDVVLEWSLGASLQAVVLDGKTGDPIETMSVSVGLRWPMPINEALGTPRRSFPDGLVHVDGLWPGEGDTLEWSVEAPGYEPYSQAGIPIAPDQALDIGAVRLTPMPAVRVRVVDVHTQEPIEGAEVQLRASASPGAGGARRFRARVGGGGSPAPRPVDNHRVGRTDADGRCVLSSFPGRTASLTVRAEGLAPYLEEEIELPLRDDVERDVALTPGGTVVVTVVNGAGDPVAGAEIEHDPPTSQPGGMLRTLRSGGEGRARFAHLGPGLHGFRVKDENARQGGLGVMVRLGDASVRKGSGWEDIAVGGREDLELRLIAPPRGRLRGKVTEDGVPLPNARVVLTDESDNDPMASLMGETFAYTDSSGRYAFHDLKVTPYRADVRHATRVMSHRAKIELEEGENVFDLDLPVCIVEGDVKDGAGEPVAGATLTVTRRATETGQQPRMRIMLITDSSQDSATTISSGMSDSPSTTTDERGHYVLRGVAADEELVVEARADGYEPTTSDTFTLSPGELRTSVDVQLGHGGALVVRVVTADGEPANGLLAAVSFKGESEVDVPPKATLVTDGEARFEDMQVGTWSVALSPASPPVGEPPAMPASRDVEIEAGSEATADFELPR